MAIHDGHEGPILGVSADDDDDVGNVRIRHIARRAIEIHVLAGRTGPYRQLWRVIEPGARCRRDRGTKRTVRQGTEVCRPDVFVVAHDEGLCAQHCRSHERDSSQVSPDLVEDD